MKKLPTACGLALCLLLSITSLSRAQDDDGPTKINFDDIKLKLVKGQTFRKSMLTKKAKSYDGKTVSIRGYMIPSFKADGITDFVLMRNGECLFGQDAAHHFIRVVMKDGQSTRYTLRPITVEGDFKIKQFKVGKETWAIYELNDGFLGTDIADKAATKPIDSNQDDNVGAAAALPSGSGGAGMLWKSIALLTGTVVLALVFWSISRTRQARQVTA